jgi:hypothetical protein
MKRFRIGKAPIGDRGDEDERPMWQRRVSIEFGFSWRAAKRRLREEAERKKQIRDQLASRSAAAPEPTIDDGVRQWASPALLRRLRGGGQETER